jgi:hypothetical protein
MHNVETILCIGFIGLISKLTEIISIKLTFVYHH